MNISASTLENILRRLPPFHSVDGDYFNIEVVPQVGRYDDGAGIPGPIHVERFEFKKVKNDWNLISHTGGES